MPLTKSTKNQKVELFSKFESLLKILVKLSNVLLELIRVDVAIAPTPKRVEIEVKIILYFLFIIPV